SPGVALDKVSLREYVTYNNATPQRTYRDAIFRVSSYDRAQIEIAPLNTPLFTRGEEWGGTEGGFEDEDHPSSIRDAVSLEAGYVGFDTPTLGHKAFLDPGVGGEGSEVVWEYDVDDRENPEVVDWVTPESVSLDEQYVEVIVRDRLENTRAVNGVGPQGRYRIWEAFAVYYDETPQDAQTDFVDASAYATDAEARKEARRRARLYTEGGYEGVVTVSFNHLLEPYDAVMIRATRDDETGRYLCLWRCTIDGIAHDLDFLQTALSFTASLVSEIKVQEALAPLSYASPSVLEAITPQGLFPDWGETGITFAELETLTYAELD
ncbi:MAG: hypothetical protein WKF67_07390, partial [Rubrobacteraceae bacterium]